MFGSLKIATIRGIPIRLHITLVGMLAVLMVRFGVVAGIPAGVLLFGSVLLHELGHSLVAQRYGIRIAGIDLHLLGGMALMTRPPRTPREEVLIAAAGPAVSFVLGSLFLFLGALAGFDYSLVGPPTLSTLITYAAMINLAMAVFNLIPALPMDGGRIFRALLSPKLGALKATRVAAWVSRAFAVVFIGVGVYTQSWSLALIGGLLFLMVANEERIVTVQEEMRARMVELDPLQASMPPEPRETREEFVDSWGRRYVVIVRLAEQER